MFRRRACGFRRSVRLRFHPPPPCPVPAPAKFSSSSDGRLPPSAIPVYHPVLASCSARLLFVSFMVRISGSFYCSVQFSLFQFRSSCPVRFRSFSFVSVSFRRIVFELIFTRCARSQAIYIYFSRILYTTGGDFQMYFLSENMFFLRIVQNIDINFEIPKRMDTVFFTIPETTQKSQRKGVFPVLPKGDRPRQKKRHRAITKVNEQQSNKKVDMIKDHKDKFF